MFRFSSVLEGTGLKPMFIVENIQFWSGGRMWIGQEQTKD